MSIFQGAANVARRLGPLGGLAARVLEAVDPPERPAPPREPDSPAALMANLLERSLQQDTAAGQRDAHVAVLRQLVPDEARIIAALAAGPPAPLVHVLARGGGERILQNASLIGRTAALTLPSMTPTYVTHLRQLGLVETGPEDPEAAQGYEMLMADREVRAALKEGELGKLPAKTVRRTLQLSPRGRALWEATQH